MPIASLSDIKNRDDANGGGGGGDGIPASAMEGPVDGEKLGKWFMGLYHEKQIGGLCAVHCLNNLMQESMFDEIELSEVAHTLDKMERDTLGGAGLDMESGNVRADGFFSVQVIQQALQARGFQCLPIGSTEAKAAQDSPVRETAFICNRSEHWFALRRVGNFWFDLNSMLKQPKLVSDTYLAMTLQQLRADGYSVFVVRGGFAPTDLERDRKRLEGVAAACKGDGPTGQVSASQSSATSATAFTGEGYSLSGARPAAAAGGGSGDAALAAALADAGVDPNADPELAAAIAQSLKESAGAAAPAEPALDPAEEMRRKRLARFGG